MLWAITDDGWAAIISAVGAAIIIPAFTMWLSDRKERHRTGREEARERLQDKRDRMAARRTKRAALSIKTELAKTTEAAAKQREEVAVNTSQQLSSLTDSIKQTKSDIEAKVDVVYKATNSIVKELVDKAKETGVLTGEIKERDRADKVGSELSPGSGSHAEEIAENTKKTAENTERTEEIVKDIKKR